MKTQQKSQWNKEVESKVDELSSPLIDWVKRQIINHPESTWFDKFTGQRALHYLELARWEIYNDMYYSSAKEREADLKGQQFLE